MKLSLSVAAGAILAMAARPPAVAGSEGVSSRSAVELQELRWGGATLRPEWVGRVDKAIDLYERNKGRYVAIEKMRPHPSVPSRVIFVLHGRESTWSFAKHLHEGSPLTGRTRWVPKGRPVKGEPPFTFEESAEDALYKLKNMENWDWSSVGATLQNIETYNGLGYQKYHKDTPSPYLWSGTNRYSRGKYVADGKFSTLAIDKQIGCAAILLRMKQRGVR